MSSIIYKGLLKDLNSSLNKEFILMRGVNRTNVLKMEDKWMSAHSNTIRQILDKANGDEVKTQELLDNCQIEDRGWSWSNKYNCLKENNNYEWFFIIIDNEVQGCCIICHPKDSRIDNKEVFYVDYIAIAPWNRETIFNKRQFSSVGTILLSIATSYSVSNYDYRHGFGLHALPQAESYYLDKIGMDNYGKDKDKENLCYFEISEEKAKELVNNNVKTK